MAETTWKSATRQVWKSALRKIGRSSLSCESSRFQAVSFFALAARGGAARQFARNWEKKTRYGGACTRLALQVQSRADDARPIVQNAQAHAFLIARGQRKTDAVVLNRQQPAVA